jgi:hypothetical protein
LFLKLQSPECAFDEFWISLASLLRSYTALHGLATKREALVESDGERIVVRCGEKRLDLTRNGAAVNWRREDGRSGRLDFTEAGRLRSEAGEDEMDMAAEAWARELMQ